MADQGKRIAVFSEALYLVNLLLPVIPFLFLLTLYFRHRQHESVVARNHLKQATTGATIATVVFIIANIVVMLFGGYKSITALITFEVYYIVFVPLFLIPGLFGLIRAMSGESYRFPLIGKYAEME